jgi:hypothetical protein
MCRRRFGIWDAGEGSIESLVSFSPAWAVELRVRVFTGRGAPTDETAKAPDLPLLGILFWITDRRGSAVCSWHRPDYRLAS